LAIVKPEHPAPMMQVVGTVPDLGTVILLGST
jgi:hypothetical protein